MALVHAHRPPERHSLATVDRLRHALDRFGREPRLGHDSLESEFLDKLLEFVESARMRIDEAAVDPSALDKKPREPVKQRLV